MNNFLLTIVIISHKQIHLVQRLLSSLKDHPPRDNYQVIVLENSRGQPELPLKDYNFPVTYKKNDFPRSFSANINHLFESMENKSEYFCILNPDIVFQQEVYDELISALIYYKLDIIAPLVLNNNGIVQDSFRAIPSPKEIFLRYLKVDKTRYDIEALPVISYPDWIAGMFMLMTSKAFEKIGGFDTRYNLYFEDVDFCIRAKRKGFQIGVVKNVKVVHEAQRTSHKNLLHLFKHTVSAIKFFSSKEYQSSRSSYE